MPQIKEGDFTPIEPADLPPTLLPHPWRHPADDVSPREPWLPRPVHDTADAARSIAEAGTSIGGSVERSSQQGADAVHWIAIAIIAHGLFRLIGDVAKLIFGGPGDGHSRGADSGSAKPDAEGFAYTWGGKRRPKLAKVEPPAGPNPGT